MLIAILERLKPAWQGNTKQANKKRKMQKYLFNKKKNILDDRKHLLPLKRFIVHFLTTLNPRKLKVR